LLQKAPEHQDSPLQSFPYGGPSYLSQHFYAKPAEKQRGDLFMNVHEKRIGRPTILLSEFVAVNVVEVYGHGAPRSEGVAPDSLWRKALYIKPLSSETAVMIILLMFPACTGCAECVLGE
jgi:hypothetical protein